MPLPTEEAEQYYNRGGEFTTLRKLVPKPGDTVTVLASDIMKNHKTKFPIKDKDYNYRVTLTSQDGQAMLLDLNGANVIGQFIMALYPQGVRAPLVPCRVRITRRAERKMSQSEVVVERVDGEATGEDLSI